MKRQMELSLVKIAATAVLTLAVVMVGAALLLYRYTAAGRAGWNTHMREVRHADDSTRYATLKYVEDTCRALQASYYSDLDAWRVYEDSGQRDLAAQLLIRVNRTAAVYNEYVLKNGFVWKNGIPEDIKQQLPPVRPR